MDNTDERQVKSEKAEIFIQNIKQTAVKALKLKALMAVIFENIFYFIYLIFQLS